MKLPVEDPLLAEGAGLAARTPEQLLVGIPRDGDLESQTPVTAIEYDRLRKERIFDPHQFAGTNQYLRLAAFAYWENTVAAAGDVVNGSGELLLDQNSSGLLLRITPIGEKSFDVPVTGVPVVALKCPRQAEPDWDQEPATSAGALPQPLRRLVDRARTLGLPLGARPMIDRDRLYAGWSLSVADRFRVDVTGAAGFLFPTDLAAPGVDARAAHERAMQQLDSDEPSFAISDFDCRYLASALISVRYARMRRAERGG